MSRVYKRKFKGLIKKANAKAIALKYPEFKVGDRVMLHDNILDIDARITGAPEGYTGAQVRRRNRYRMLLNKSARGTIVCINIADIYVHFKSKKYRELLKKYEADKPLLFRKQMIKHL